MFRKFSINVLEICWDRANGKLKCWGRDEYSEYFKLLRQFVMPIKRRRKILTGDIEEDDDSDDVDFKDDRG